MKLNKYHKTGFVRAVLQDVPQVDYEELIRETVEADNLAGLPAKVRAVADDPKLKGYLETHFYYVRARCMGSTGVSVYGLDSKSYAPRPDTRKRLNELVELREKQYEVTIALHRQLNDAINSVSTLKQAREALPEFAKYLPTEIVRGKYSPPAPIVANLVADLNKAGWPKGEKPAEAKRGRGRPRKSVEVTA